MNPEEIEERFKLLLDKIDRDIATHGMSVIGVMDDPQFSYTIGLWCRGDPELIICGMNPVQAHQILTSAEIALKEGLVIEDGGEEHGVLVDLPVRFREIPEPRSPLNVARRFHGEDFPAYQIIWPDKNGLFPGDEGYEYSDDQQTLPAEEEET